MSLFEVPKDVARKLEKLQRNFLWDGKGEKKQLHLVIWEEVTNLKEKGARGFITLGIGTMLYFASGYGGLHWKRGLYGEKIWSLDTGRMTFVGGDRNIGLLGRVHRL